ncbi:uncharacterized protein LOC120806979 [Xiphias gladius]|uniref:uncharacterized protein LOC120806979 n=1 Tax=Xiphias gladius TaxID=8245 RepID=UPI001A98E1F9|nr:uncharacterized protein LOC120806979 [Xiphias gladius]
MAYERRLPTLLLTFILCFSPWPTSGNKFFSHRGQQCLDPCELQGYPQLYQCKVRMKDGNEEHQYCSPRRNVDYRGYECLNCCEEHGYNYHWCTTNSGWGYCGEVVGDMTHYTSTYDLQCQDGCERRSSDYYWCYTAKGYDYCSPSQNVDYKGNVCQKDYPCDKYGKDYYWCYLEKGSWDKCARVEIKAMIYQTINKEDCIDDCKYHESKGYFWCNKRESWDYCSPLSDITYKNVPCRQNHECGAHGQQYTWCYTTENNNWDYCGVILPGECSYSQSQRTKRSPNEAEVICTKEDNNNRRVTTFLAEAAPGDIAECNNRLRAEAVNLINRWDNQRLSDQARSNLLVSDNLRIDLQRLFVRNNQQYYNLQIQRNIPRGRHQSTTISQILVPVGTSSEYMRFAFRESLTRRARITLEVTEQPITQRCQRRRP